MKYPYGAPFGEPHKNEQQMTILRDLLLTAQRAQIPGNIVELPYKWRRTEFFMPKPEDFLNK